MCVKIGIKKIEYNFTLQVPHKTSFFSVIAGVPNGHPRYYVYQVAPYERSEEKLRGHATHTEPPSGTGKYARRLKTGKAFGPDVIPAESIESDMETSITSIFYAA